MKTPKSQRKVVNTYRRKMIDDYGYKAFYVLCSAEHFDKLKKYYARLKKNIDNNNI